MNRAVYVTRCVVCAVTRSALACMLIVGNWLALCSSTPLLTWLDRVELNLAPFLAVFLAATILTAVGVVLGGVRMPVSADQ